MNSRTNTAPDEIVGHKTIDTGEIGPHGFPILRHEPLTRAELAALQAQPEAGKEPAAGEFNFKDRYFDLLMSVCNKHPGETRHATAKRYIQQAERGSDTPAQAKSDATEGSSK